MHLPPSSFVGGIRKVVRDFFGPWTRDMMGSLEFVPKILKLVFKVRCLGGKGGGCKHGHSPQQSLHPPTPPKGAAMFGFWFM